MTNWVKCGYWWVARQAPKSHREYWAKQPKPEEYTYGGKPIGK